MMTARTFNQCSGGARRAFTLIEVMIAVIVLALGLLGLGAVFPVVVRAQRQSTEDTLGTAAINSARAFLSSYNYRSAMRPLPNGSPMDARNLWRAWRDDEDDGLNPPNGPSPSLEEGAWMVPAVSNTTGAVLLGVPANDCEVVIPVRERLFPLGAAGDPAPQFVWDVAIHRVSDFNEDTDATFDDLELVVFVQRIDPRIKVPAAHNLYQVLTGEREGGVTAANRRRAIGAFDTGPQLDFASGDGTGKYASLMVAEVELRPNSPAQPVRDRLYYLGPTTDAAWRIMRQPGQRLVDNMGQIHTVRSWSEDGPAHVILETPVKIAPTTSEALQQVVFARQIPASVFIHRIKP